MVSVVAYGPRGPWFETCLGRRCDLEQVSLLIVQEAMDVRLTWIDRDDA